MILAASLAYAAQIAPVDRDAVADTVASGEVADIWVESDAGLLWSVARLDDGTVFRLPGGCLDGICVTVPGAPRIAVGDHVRVWLRGEDPVGLWAGIERFVP
ncbi:MAG: hypothetical protein ACOZNI_28165 [Myxococcota bacterium]